MPKKQNNIQALSKKIVYDRLSEAAQNVFDNIKKATKNFTKDDEKSVELFMKFYNNLVEKKPLAVRGTEEFKKEENRARVQRWRDNQKSNKAKKRKHPTNEGTGSERDAARVGKRVGWRLPHSNRIPTEKQKRDGTAYYEDRVDRSDVNRKGMPYLKDGGEIDNNGINTDDYVLIPNPEFKHQIPLQRFLMVHGDPNGILYKLAILLLLGVKNAHKILGYNIEKIKFAEEHGPMDVEKYMSKLNILANIAYNGYPIDITSKLGWLDADLEEVEKAEAIAIKHLKMYFNVIKKPANYEYLYDEKLADGGEINNGDLITFKSDIVGECKGYISDWNINTTSKNKEIAYVVTKHQMNSDKYIVCSGIVRGDNKISHTVQETSTLFSNEAEALEVARKMASDKEYAEEMDKFAKGGKLKDDATYIPNRDIKELSIILKGKLTSVKGTDVLDGVYLKKFKQESKSNENAFSVHSSLLALVNNFYPRSKDKQKYLDNVKLTDITKLIKAGYNKFELIILYFGLKTGLGNDLKCDIEENSPQILLKLSPRSLILAVDELITAAKNKDFKLFLDYPSFDWSTIIKKYKVVDKSYFLSLNVNNSGTFYSYQYFIGKNVIFVNYLDYSNKEIKSIDQLERRKENIVQSIYTPTDYQKERDYKAGFNGGSWTIISSKNEVIDDIIIQLASQSQGTVKTIYNYIYNSSAINAEQLHEKGIKFAKGGRMPFGSVKGRLNIQIREMLDKKFEEFLVQNKFNKNAILYFTNIATNSALLEANFTFTKELNEIFKTSIPIKIRENEEENQKMIQKYTEFVTRFGEEIAETAKWDADDIINGVSYFLSMNGLNQYAEKLEGLKLKYAKGGLTKKRTMKSIEADKRIKALHGGKRTSIDGNVYYEYRDNHSDVNRTKRFALGGIISKTHRTKSN